jgi:tRNA pseudouridine55 synthase
MRQTDGSLDGLLNVNKPAGWTSHDVVAKVRRLSGERHTGHAGTLDPLATGVLPLGIGQGTRVLEYLASAGKTYRAVIRLGVSTDTYDAEGAVTASASALDIPLSSIEQALAPFHGTFQQRAPMFSALKVRGRPLYRYARAGSVAEPPLREVRVDALRVRTYDPPDLEVEIECASGFYVRSLAHDLGQSLGCGGHVRALSRTRVGPFAIEDAVAVETLAGGRVRDWLLALDAPLRFWPALIVGAGSETQVLNGRPLWLAARNPLPARELCRAYSASGELVAVLRLLADGSARAVKVFPPGRRGLNLPADDTPNAVIGQV